MGVERAMGVQGREAGNGCKRSKFHVVIGIGFVGSKGVVGEDFGNQPSELDQVGRVVFGFFVVFIFGNGGYLIELEV